MIDPVQYLANAEHELSLSADERAAGRMALRATMTLSLTSGEKTDIRRALQRAVYADPAPFSLWEFLRSPVRLQAVALAALLLVAASGGGLVYAAENALPGDPLYGMKLHVNEAFRARLNATPEARAQWAVERLQRRMRELHRLEERGTAEADIDVAIGGHIEEAAYEIEVEVEALPAAAAERAAMRTAVRAAIGTDDGSLRRASRINRVLKALHDRAEQFDAPVPTSIAPAVIPDAEVELDLGANVGATASSARGTKPRTSSAASSRERAMSSERSSAAVDSGEAVTTSSNATVTTPVEEASDDVGDVLDGVL